MIQQRPPLVLPRWWTAGVDRPHHTVCACNRHSCARVPCDRHPTQPRHTERQCYLCSISLCHRLRLCLCDSRGRLCSALRLGRRLGLRLSCLLRLVREVAVTLPPSCTHPPPQRTHSALSHCTRVRACLLRLTQLLLCAELRRGNAPSSGTQSETHACTHSRLLPLWGGDEWVRNSTATEGARRLAGRAIMDVPLLSPPTPDCHRTTARTLGTRAIHRGSADIMIIKRIGRGKSMPISR